MIDVPTSSFPTHEDAAHVGPDPAVALAEADARLLGTGFTRRHPDGRIEHIPAAEIQVHKFAPTHCPICGQKDDGSQHCTMGGCPIGGDL